MIDWDYTQLISLIIGVVGTLIIVFIFRRKKKHQLNNLRNLVYEAGIHVTNAMVNSKQAYERIKKLETFFKDVENLKESDEK